MRYQIPPDPATTYTLGAGPGPHPGFVAVTRRVENHGPPYHMRHPRLRRLTFRQPNSRRRAAC